MPATRLAGRVIARLAQAEVLESNSHYRDDLRIARLTVAYAASGEARLCSPHVLASYTVLGLHPEKVWPAIQARRKALGPLVSIGPPKKPPQSVKLWSSKANGARALNSRAGYNDSPRTNDDEPMAAPSIAALYPNSDAPSSAKKRGFTYDEMLAIVEFSGAPHSVRQGTLSALKARGQWPGEDGPATGIVCISLIGMQLHGVCCRSTARWRARRAVRLGFWRELRKANAWSDCPKCGAKRKVGTCDACGYVGRAKTPEGRANFDEFCRPYMYEIDIEKFRTAPRPKEIRHFDARTYAEYKQAAKRGEHPNVTPIRKPAQPTPPDPPPTKAAPLPQRTRPAAEHHRGTERISAQIESRSSERKRALRTGVLADMSKLMSDGASEEDALKKVCRSWGVTAEEARTILRECLFEPPQRADSPPGRPDYSEKCRTCGSDLAQNRGPGPRLICPKCRE